MNIKILKVYRKTDQKTKWPSPGVKPVSCGQEEYMYKAGTDPLHLLAFNIHAWKISLYMYTEYNYNL